MSVTKIHASGITSALTEAESILSAAELRAEEIKSAAGRAYDDAKRAGREAGYQQGRKEALGEAVKLIQDRVKVSERLSQQAAELALAIAGSVIGEQVKVDVSLVRRIAERALAQSVVGDAITIIANPEDTPMLLNSQDDLRRLSGGASIKIESDPAIARGGCTVRTEFGEVDATIPALIESVATRLNLIMK